MTTVTSRQKEIDRLIKSADSMIEEFDETVQSIKHDAERLMRMKGRIFAILYQLDPSFNPTLWKEEK